MILQNTKKAHCIGIKGSGMTALAEVFIKNGIGVTGSDVEEIFFTDAILKKLNVVVYQSFSENNIPKDVDLIVYSTTYTKENNVELKAALEIGVPVLSYPEVLGEIMKEKIGLAVCGTHGKTTTSALLAEVLRTANEDPLAIVGSHILQWEGNALVGNGKFFVLEADEYQNKLRYYSPFGVILTSVDFDHPDFFTDFEMYKKTFSDLAEKIPHHGVLVSWGDSSSVNDVSKNAHCHQMTYGFLEENTFQIKKYTPIPVLDNASLQHIKQTFEIVYEGNSLGEFSLQLAGKHNALNAAAVVALCVYLKLDIEKVRSGLAGFSGTARRFEYVGMYKDAMLYDDYAHHPEELKATLKAFRDLYPSRRLITVFHPHTFTRTKALLSEFSQSFDDADIVYILDIYGSAREQSANDVSSADIVQLINRYNRGKAAHVSTVENVLDELKLKILPGDVVVTLGAGNVWEVSHKLANYKA